MDIRLRTAIAPWAYPFWFAWRLCVDTVGAGCTGVGVNKLGPPGLMLFCVEDTGGVVVVVVVAVGRGCRCGGGLFLALATACRGKPTHCDQSTRARNSRETTNPA